MTWSPTCSWSLGDAGPSCRRNRCRGCWASARHVLANHARGQSRRVRLHDRLAAEPVMAAAPPMRAGEIRALEAALASLSERDRELLLLMAWEGLELRQAAEVLGVRPNTLGGAVPPRPPSPVRRA